jgi:2-amino-4-hydroxy-6-hydroxymethyldihydropteridine diphosphokinase
MMERPRDVVIALGANLGDRRATIDAAIVAISSLPGTQHVATSHIRETAPLGPPQPAYLNGAIRVTTTLSPRALLDALLAIEASFGRARREKWGPRTLDLDILFIDGEVCDEPGLSVPHPHLRERTFALEPLLDVAPSATDPRDGEPYSRALERLRAM